MKLAPGRLAAHLASGLAPIYLLSGDEPLLVDEALDALREAARKSGIDERDSSTCDRNFDWDLVPAGLANGSLFSTGKLLELRLPTAAPGDEGSRMIRQLAARGADGNVVVLLTPALNRKTASSAWVGAVVEHGAWVDLPRPEGAELEAWVGRRLAAAGFTCEREGIALIADRVEGNLLAARQEIDKLSLLHPAGKALGTDEVRESVADGARFDVFQLADAALGGDVARVARILAGLREEGTAPPLVLWSLGREVLSLVDAASRTNRGVPQARALEEAGIWRSRADLYLRALKAQPPGGFSRLTLMAARADRLVKGAGRGDPWNALLELACALGGQPGPHAELA